MTSLYERRMAKKKRSEKNEVDLTCNERMPDDDEVFIKDEGFMKKSKYKCHRCQQVLAVPNICIMCPDKVEEHGWYHIEGRDEKEEDDRYTTFWKSRAGAVAIANARTWNWDTYDFYNKTHPPKDMK